MPIKRVQVVCLANAVTGGPESLHNLVAAVSSLGIPASMVYFPFSQLWPTPAPYRHYGAEVSVLNDAEDTLVIFPEILCMEALRLTKAKVAIWWLSLDFFRERKYHNWRDSYRYTKRVLQGRRPLTGLRALRGLIHFSKAHYDESYLKKNNIIPMRLTGPISRFYLSSAERNEAPPRGNRILYNPKKGKAAYQTLIARYPKYEFEPLTGLDEIGLDQKYRASKLYIDFGHHPGRERMPREAAVCGCCVVTGREGSAANPFDIAIPDSFKLDERSANFAERFGLLADQVLEDFEAVSAKFESYRDEIRNEPFRQLEDLKRILASLS
jgi:hypothetical protein